MKSTACPWRMEQKSRKRVSEACLREVALATTKSRDLHLRWIDWFPEWQHSTVNPGDARSNFQQSLWNVQKLMLMRLSNDEVGTFANVVGICKGWTSVWNIVKMELRRKVAKSCLLAKISAKRSYPILRKIAKQGSGRGLWVIVLVSIHDSAMQTSSGSRASGHRVIRWKSPGSGRLKGINIGDFSKALRKASARYMHGILNFLTISGDVENDSPWSTISPATGRYL